MNTEILKSLIRSALVSISAALVARHLATPGQSADLVTYGEQFIPAVIAIVWSIYRHSYPVQAKKAIDLVNSVSGIVGDATTGNVQLLPGASSKPDQTPPAPVSISPSP